MSAEPLFHPLKPGIHIPGDWFKGSIPVNIRVGENCVINSSYCFKHYFSALPTGLCLGSNVTLWQTSLACEENGCIEIGDYCYITNASIVCAQKISIRSRVFIAGGVTIADSDFHPVGAAARVADTIALSPIGDRRLRPMISSMPVTIEDDVWIGYNATILKGVTIGAGAVICPGAVVIKNILRGTTVAGNPATIIN
jgi:acetyltransferase-like isoleucine patch superfamily enzyme